MKGKKTTVEDVRIMMRLREEEGLSNRQIAERLDIGINTVYRCIGAAGYRIVSCSTPVADKPTEPEQPKCALPIIRRRITLKGLALTLELDSKDNTCAIRANSDSLQFEGIVPCELLEQIGLELIEASKY